MAVLWLRRLVTGLSPRKPGFAPMSFCVGMRCTEWHWYKFFSEFFSFALSVSSIVAVHAHTLSGGRTIGPLVAAVQRQCHNIDIKNKG
jgi:hypothetical protein